MAHGRESSLELQAGWDASSGDHQPHRELGLGHNSAFCRIQGPWPPRGVVCAWNRSRVLEWDHHVSSALED